MITTCFFDLGNVLVNFSHQKMWSQLSLVCQLPPSQLMKILGENSLWSRYEIGDVSTEIFLKEFKRQSKATPKDHELILAACDIFEENTEMTNFLKKLYKKKLKLVLISNTCDIHYDYIQTRYPIFDLFSEIILSYKVKMRKPDKKIFEYALEKTDSTAHQSIFIDDLEKHVSSARKLGIHGLIFKNASLLEKDFSLLGIKL